MASKYLILHRQGWPTRATLLDTLTDSYDLLLRLQEEKHSQPYTDIEKQLRNHMRDMVQRIEVVRIHVKQLKRDHRQLNLPL